MRNTTAGMMTALCLKHLRRHPLELDHLPASVLIDLFAYGRLVAGDIGDEE